ncbi:MAG TPA: cache domain-containing protein [Patescibacteria group bacterium]|nr:cache domain-containing protein [Patescibacteria group bacterium]
MWTNFALQNLRFAVYLFGGLVMASTAWLYLDAAGEKKSPLTLSIMAGFFLLALGFTAEALSVEGATVGGGQLESIIVMSATWFRFVGYLLIILGTTLDPLTMRPSDSKAGFLGGGVFGLPILAGLAGLSYLRRSSVGLERHLRRPAIGLFLIALSEQLLLSKLFTSTGLVWLWLLIKPFGSIWLVQIGVAFLGFGVLGSWVFSYLLKRFETQLTLILSVFVVSIYMVTTIFFSGILLLRIRQRAEASLLQGVATVDLVINKHREELLSDAKWLAGASDIMAGLEVVNKKEVNQLLVEYLIGKQVSSIVVTDDGGKVVARGEDTAKLGDSISEDRFVKKALEGETESDLEAVDSGLVKSMNIVVAAPIVRDGEILGVVRISDSLDKAFVSSVGKALETSPSVYVGNLLSASSLGSETGSTLKEESEVIKNEVLGDGRSRVIEKDLFDRGYLVAFAPIKNSLGQTVGMKSVAEPITKMMAEVGRAIYATFVLAVVLMILSQIPSYLIARYITKQIR